MHMVLSSPTQVVCLDVSMYLFSLLSLLSIKISVQGLVYKILMQGIQILLPCTLHIKETKPVMCMKPTRSQEQKYYEYCKRHMAIRSQGNLRMQHARSVGLCTLTGLQPLM